MRRKSVVLVSILSVVLFVPSVLVAQVAVRGETVHTMAGAPIKDGVVLIREGKIDRVGPASSVSIPDGFRVLTAKVVTPGLIDAHTVVGIAGYLNQPHDQEQLEPSAPMQPELRAMDAYDARARLVEWLREFGITTIHTGHAPGALISGRTMIVKTRGANVEEAVLVPDAMVAATLGDSARAEDRKAPGTRAKMVAMLRTELVKAQGYLDKQASDDENKPDRDLRLEVFAKMLRRELPILVTAHRSQDILTAIRLAKEFDLRLVLDGAAESYLVSEQIRASGYPVILHPTMYRAGGETENLTMEAASRLKAANILFALQSGYESYVPKTRVVLFEAAVAAANGLSFEEAFATITIDAARLLGIDDRVGSLEAGKDGDVALYDGDPFEYTSHCVGTVIEGKVVSEVVR